MYIFLIVVHVIVCLVLILVVLLQAGRGGGVSDMMGGGQPQSIFGTQTNSFMMRATEACAVLFIITSLSLGIITSQRGKSLVEKQGLDKLKSKLATAAKTAVPPSAPASSVTPAAAASEPAKDSTSISPPAVAAAASTSAAPAGANAS